jgi:hypothetical protein
MQIISVICGELIMIHVTMFRWSSGAWSDWNKQSCPRRCHRRPSTLYRRTSQWQDWVSSRRPPVYLHMDQNPQDSAWAGLPGTTAIVFGWSAWWLHAGGNDMQRTDISDQRTINICVHAMKVSTHVLWSWAGKPKQQNRPTSAPRYRPPRSLYGCTVVEENSLAAGLHCPRSLNSY